MTSKHPIVHIEFSAKDLKETGQFYANVFDWELTEFPDMNYTTFEAKPGTGGGFSPVNEGTPAGQVLVYINTPDLKESLEKIKANGGKIVLESMEVPTVGTIATFTDPSGNLVAVLQPEEKWIEKKER